MKHLFFIIHIILLTLAAYQGVNIMYKEIKSPSLHGALNPADNMDLVSEQTGKHTPDTHKNRYQKISTRNIFKVLTTDSDKTSLDPKLTNPEKKLEKTELKIALWGTVIGDTQASSYAVIEDKKERKQSLFQVGEIIQQATIKEIMRSKIILTFKGKDQMLEVDTSKQPAGMAVPNNLFPPKAVMNGQIQGERQLPTSTDPASLMKQVRIRPYFKSGKPNGLLLYGIKPGSVYRQLGLKNGDVVQEFNGTQTLTAQDAKMIYQDLEAASDMRFLVLRRGQKKEILYNADNNSYTEHAVPKE